MMIKQALTVATFAFSLSMGAAHAQLSKTQPAEFPPASYKGKQYVDSTGCVFIRAGIDGNVSWIPRVTRDRKTVCGFKPTQAAAAAPAQAAPSAKPPVDIALEDTVAPAVVPAPKSAPRRVAPKPRKAVPVRRVAKAAPRRVAPAAPQVYPGTACPKHSPLGQRYTVNRQGLDIRCGPQTAPIPGVRGVPLAGRDAAENITRQTRIVPKHVAENRVNTTNVKTPKGYKRVWKDGRLNPRRAEQTLQGRDQMALIWTNTVPRRLINPANGDDVTATVPLVYPYTSVAQQRRELGEVTIVQRDGKKMKRIVRNRAVVARKPVYSSRSAPKPVAPKATQRNSAVAGKRYVQVGVFGQQGNAQKAAQRIARMGLPARIGSFRKGGKTYMSVQAGPFNGAQGTARALQQLRSSGFRDAFARN